MMYNNFIELFLFKNMKMNKTMMKKEGKNYMRIIEIRRNFLCLLYS